MTEQSIAAARASVMVYDDSMKKWVPSGSSSGLSKVHIYQHLANATFRVVGRKLGDHEVVINTSIFKGLKYNQATPTFHQWRDKNQVHGLNFSSRDDAEAFAQAMLRSLDLVNQTGASPRPPPPPPMNLQPVYQSIPGEIDCNNIEPQKWLDSDSGRITHQIQYTSNTVIGQQQANGPQSNSTGSPNNTLHRSAAPPNCAPPAPPPPPAQPNIAAAPPPPPPPPPPPGPGLPPCPPPMPSSGGPPPPPAPPAFAGPPCPPPPPGSLQQRPNAANVSLASALANAKLKQTQKGENGGGGSSEASKTPGPASGSMASMMDEMAKTLARRRAQAENSQGQDVGDCTDKKFWEKQNSSNGNNGTSGLESPKSSRRQRIGSVSEENFRANGPDVFDMERLKQEIMVEIRMEINKLKQDIIDAIRVELNRR